MIALGGAVLSDARMRMGTPGGTPLHSEDEDESEDGGEDSSSVS